MIELRATSFHDLETLLALQIQGAGKGNCLFPIDDPSNKNNCFKRWNSLLLDSDFHAKTIFYHQQIIGCLMKLIREEKAELFYLLDHNFSKNQIAKKALDIFLQIEDVRPIYIRMNGKNEKLYKIIKTCGFQKVPISEYVSNTISDHFYCLKR
jgi:hypothetical protein